MTDSNLAVKWRLAKSLILLRSQINSAWPNRAKSSDGSIGNLAHQATKSDHNPNADGIVLAIDVTNDPPHECHAGLIVEALRASRDPRLGYLIFNHFMLRSYERPGIPAWQWAPYTGPSPHDHHFHMSVLPALADDVTRAWRIT